MTQETQCPSIKALLLVIVALIAASFSSVDAAPPPDVFGVWDRSGKFDSKDYPFMRGFTFDQTWREVESKPDIFDWSELDKAVDKAFKNKQFMYLSLGVGPDAPAWIYEQGVPKVMTKGEKEKHENKWDGYPYYLDHKYKQFFHRLITEWAQHIRSYPKEKQDLIAFIVPSCGLV